MAPLSVDHNAVAAGYDMLAPEYETLFGEEARATWRGGLLRLTTLRPEGARILDLGAGTGIGGRLLRPFRPSQLVGLDASAAMLGLAADAYDNVVVGDIERLPFASNTFDLCVAGFDTLNHLPLPRFATALSQTNVGRVAPRLAFDCFTHESQEALLDGTPRHRIEQVEPGTLLSAHQASGQDILLAHFLPSYQQLISYLEACRWRIIEMVKVRVCGRESVPGHVAFSLERISDSSR